MSKPSLQALDLVVMVPMMGNRMPALSMGVDNRATKMLRACAVTAVASESDTSTLRQGALFPRKRWFRVVQMSKRPETGGNRWGKSHACHAAFHGACHGQKLSQSLRPYAIYMSLRREMRVSAECAAIRGERGNA